jgi:hypothetical protein
VELEPRGLYDRTMVRRGIARALRRTLANLDAVFSRYPEGIENPGGLGRTPG